MKMRDGKTIIQKSDNNMEKKNVLFMKDKNGNILKVGDIVHNKWGL